MLGSYALTAAAVTATGLISGSTPVPPMPGWTMEAAVTNNWIEEASVAQNWIEEPPKTSTWIEEPSV